MLTTEFITNVRTAVLIVALAYVFGMLTVALIVLAMALRFKRRMKVLVEASEVPSARMRIVPQPSEGGRVIRRVPRSD